MLTTGTAIFATNIFILLTVTLTSLKKFLAPEDCSSNIEQCPMGSPGSYGCLSAAGHRLTLLWNPYPVTTHLWVWWILSGIVHETDLSLIPPLLNRRRRHHFNEGGHQRQIQTPPIVSSYRSCTRAFGWFGLPALHTASRVIAGRDLVCLCFNLCM